MAGVCEKITVSAFTGVIGPLLGKLSKLIEEEYAKVKGVRKKVESLKRELIIINVTLEKYAAMESPDMQVRAWMKDVREVAYNIEDCIDLFLYHVDHEPAENAIGIKGLIRKSIRKLKKFKYRHKFAEQIHQLKDLVNETYEQHVKYKIDDCNSSVMHTEIDPRLPALYVEVEKLVAVEGLSEEIISQLIDEESDTAKQHRVVSIVGSGGSGKTTLANQVYQEIKGRFSCRGFVCVSQKPIMVNILRDLLLEIENGDIRSDEYLSTRSYSERHLIDRIRAHLENKRYLIVIDDIWSQSAWEQIQCVLPKNFHGSRIITTTRINSVANICCTSSGDFIYPMKPLSKSDSKKLFLKRISALADKCPSQLEGVMDEILHICDGLPLAIVNIASLLANKPVKREECERVRDSIGSVHGKDKELEVIDKILSLSYRDLTQPLKTCLLYLSMFPEDYIMGKYSLVWRWIAEGFVVPKHGYTLEEVGESYFNELLNRSIIQQEFKYDGEAISCRVHDMVLDFIISRSIEENFVSILDAQYIPSQPDKICRLYIRNKNEHAGGLSQQTP